MKLILRYKGGPDSGHHGHAGRPGSVGGSVSGVSPKALSTINKAFVAYFKDDLKNRYYTKVADINTGFCREWAYIVHEQHGSELWFNDTFSHAFVKHGDLFYDAGTRKGVPDWIDLRGLRAQRSGLVNMRKHGIDGSHSVSTTDFEKLAGFNMTHVKAIRSKLK